MTEMEDEGFKSTDLCKLGHGAGLNSIHSGGSCLDCKEGQNTRTTTYIQNHLQRQKKEKKMCYAVKHLFCLVFAFYLIEEM